MSQTRKSSNVVRRFFTRRVAKSCRSWARTTARKTVLSQVSRICAGSRSSIHCEVGRVGIQPTIGLPTPSKGSVTKPHLLPLVQGTLDLLVLRALASGPMHGYGVATLVHERTDGR